MNLRFAAWSALALPLFAAGLLLRRLTDPASGWTDPQWAVWLALLFAAAAAAAAGRLCRFVKRQGMAAPVRDSLLFSGCAVLLAASLLPGVVGAAKSALSGAAAGALLWASAAVQFAAAAWFLLRAAALPRLGRSAAAAWNCLPALACVLRLLERFFAGPINHRSLTGTAPLLLLSAAAVCWLRAAQYLAERSPERCRALAASALTAVWFAALFAPVCGFSVSGAADALLCVGGWLFALPAVRTEP